jgi:hypothetical protein
MNKRQILKLSNEELDNKVNELRHTDTSTVTFTGGLYAEDMRAAWDLAESVKRRGGKIKDGAWVLGTVHNGRDCAHACLMWKEKGFTKHRPLKVEVTRPRAEMAKAIAQCWVCAMMGLSDV